MYIVLMSVRKQSARVISSQVVFTGRVFKVVSDEVEEPDNVRARREIIRHPGSIVVLAVDDSKRPPRILLERQFRYAAGTRLWELPAGRIEPGEDKLRAAKRELLEETGYTARRWRPAFSFYASPGFLDETMNLFLATGLKSGEAQPEDDERISIRFFTFPQAVQMVLSRKIIDGKTIAGVLWLEKKFAKRR